MFLRDLFERRYERPSLVARLDTYADDPEMFVTFTDLLKVGIHPTSDWDDPVGIYLYPIREVMQGKASNNGKMIPFAGDRKFAFIVQSTGKMLELQNYTSSQLEADIEFLQEKFWHMLTVPNRLDSEPVERWERALVYWYEKWGQYPGAAFWRITRGMANHIELRNPGKASRMVWHQLIRACGYDGVVDRGDKIISGHEPAQAVILHTGGLRVIEAAINDLGPFNARRY